VGRYRKILAAVDGSETSMHALKEAFKLAQNEGNWITAVSVIPHIRETWTLWQLAISWRP